MEAVDFVEEPATVNWQSQVNAGLRPTSQETLLTEQQMAETLRSNPRCLLRVRMDRLQPDLMPGDRLLAELLIYRQRLLGIDPSNLEVAQCTAHW